MDYDEGGENRIVIIGYYSSDCKLHRRGIFGTSTYRVTLAHVMNCFGFEYICGEFEAALSAASATDVEQLLEQCRHRSADDGLLLELLKLKVEHTIRQHPLPDELISPIFRTRFAELSTDDFHDLVGHECLVRWILNQHMTIDDVVRALAAGDTRLRRHLNYLASTVMPIEAAVFCAGSQVLTSRLRDKLFVGRQGRGEPDYFCRIRYDDHEKMIIAARSDRRLSRQLVRIELVAPGKILVSNATRGIPLLLNSQQDVPPGATLIVDTTSLIEFASYGLRLQFRERHAETGILDLLSSSG